MRHAIIWTEKRGSAAFLIQDLGWNAQPPSLYLLTEMLESSVRFP